MIDIGVFFLIVIFLLTAIVSVVTGGTSLITVPVMMQFGIEPRVAVATNMLALTFLSLGGTLPLRKDIALFRRRLPALIGLTLVGSILGASLLTVVPTNAMPVVIATAMIVVAIFLALNSDSSLTEPPNPPSRFWETAGYSATFLLGVYGGFFSGGYVTLLTAAYVTLFRMTFLEAVAVTKVLNLFSSLVATVIFAAKGLIVWSLGLKLGVVCFIGAVLGGVVAHKMSKVWLRRVFLAVVVGLAAKTLLLYVR